MLVLLQRTVEMRHSLVHRAVAEGLQGFVLQQQRGRRSRRHRPRLRVAAPVEAAALGIVRQMQCARGQLALQSLTLGEEAIAIDVVADPHNIVRIRGAACEMMMCIRVRIRMRPAIRTPHETKDGVGRVSMRVWVDLRSGREMTSPLARILACQLELEAFLLPRAFCFLASFASYLEDIVL